MPIQEAEAEGRYIKRHIALPVPVLLLSLAVLELRMKVIVVISCILLHAVSAGFTSPG